ncbi:MAG: hypothetical protein V3U71_12615 [Cocleimonas sp.]
MLKTYMIEKVVEEQLSDNEGLMTFYLVDENGDCRTVSGKTYLDENLEPQGITTESKRELPLIDTIFASRHKKAIDIEFDSFNKNYYREVDKTINQLAFEKVQQIEKEKKLSYRISHFFSKAAS